MPYQRETVSLHSTAPDLIPQDAPGDVWNSVRNIFFRNGETRRAVGDQPTLPTTRVPRTAVFLRISGAGFWVYATADGIYAHDGTDEYDITPSGGWSGTDPFPVYTACVLNGIAFVNASDRDPVYWPGNIATPCEALPDWPAGGRCLALRAHKNFLFAIGMISEGDQRVRWSDAAEAGSVPAHWAPAADNLAGFLDLSPLYSPCLDGYTLRDTFVILKEESLWALAFTGGNAVFTARKLFAEHGLHTTGAATMGPNDELLFAGADGDVYLTDGTEVRSILDGRAQRTYYADFTSKRPAVFSATTLAREKLGILIYPSAEEDVGNLALLFDFSTGDIGFRDMPDVLCAAEGQALLDVGAFNTWDGDSGAWDADVTSWNEVAAASSVDDVLIGGTFGFALVSDGAAPDFIDGPVSARLEKSGLAFGNPERRKLARRIWPKITGREGDTLEIRLGGQEVTGGPVTLVAPVTFTIGQDRAVDAFVAGRFLTLEIISEGGHPWRLGSIDIEYKELGKW